MTLRKLLNYIDNFENDKFKEETEKYPEFLNYENMSSLFYRAIIKNNQEIFTFMLTKGCNNEINFIISNDDFRIKVAWNPSSTFYTACLFGNIFVVRDYWEDFLRSKDYNGELFRCLLVATTKKYADIFDFLFPHIGSLDLKEIKFLIESCIENGNWYCLEKFLHIPQTFNCGIHMLHLAANELKFEIVSNLLWYSNCDELNDYGYTPLMLAIHNLAFNEEFRENETNLLHMLIDNSNCNIKGKDGKTAIMFLFRKSNIVTHDWHHKCRFDTRNQTKENGIFQKLVEKTDLNIRDDYGYSFITYLVQCDDWEYFNEYISRKDIYIGNLPGFFLKYDEPRFKYSEFKKYFDRMLEEIEERNIKITFPKILRWDLVLIKDQIIWQLECLVDRDFDIDYESLFEYNGKKYSFLSFLFENNPGFADENLFEKIVTKIVEKHSSDFFKREFHNNILFWMFDNNASLSLLKYFVEYLDFKNEGFENEDIFKHIFFGDKRDHGISFAKKIIECLDKNNLFDKLIIWS